ncbi:MAG: SpoIID/LytB domain-containing protein [Proteobacteria bacterium]|nr:SpoIID/LytB domain-containing protein [Pseudomonadota bacterium]
MFTHTEIKTIRVYGPGGLGPSTPVFIEPYIAVGIMDWQHEVSGCLNGDFYGDGFGPVSGRFSVKTIDGKVVFTNEHGHEITRSSIIRLTADDNSTFTLLRVTIGISFHWERAEDQTFQGDLVLKARKDGTIAAINEIPLENYLKSVISSEMSGNAPVEFLNAHAIMSRSWLLAALSRKKKAKEIQIPESGEREADREDRVVRWYEQEDHDLYDVCADDHCQRYQGITKIVSHGAGEAVRQTSGQVITYGDEICDARYYKACGGVTEDFGTAWEDKRIPYLTSMSDAPVSHHPILTEEEAKRWVLSEPDAYCNTKDEGLLETILPNFDRETQDFFRWKVECSREELEGILREKSGFDFGTLKEIEPLQRGPSGRIFLLKIVGSKRSMVVGKELEIRRWLSRTHLYSSAFIVKVEYDSQGEIQRFIFHGAGWGHGVGLCQIGAAVMASKGFRAEEILKHYFPGTEIQRIY